MEPKEPDTLNIATDDFFRAVRNYGLKCGRLGGDPQIHSSAGAQFTNAFLQAYNEGVGSRGVELSTLNSGQYFKFAEYQGYRTDFVFYVIRKDPIDLDFIWVTRNENPLKVMKNTKVIPQ